jgi:sodium transport system permease protein
VDGAEHAPNLVHWLEQQNLRVIAAPADSDAAVRAQHHDVVLRIDANYAEDWRAGRPAGVELVFDSSRPLASGATIARVRGLLDVYSDTVGTLRLVARGIHPAVARPLLVGTRDVATPESRFDLTQQLLPYLLLLLAFIGGMQLAIDATAGERERQSLEPLLATPASREAIISAKILATAVFAMITIVVTLLAYRVSFTLLPVDLGTDFAVGPWALLKLLVVILPIVLLGATVLTALAAYARSYREAQGYLPLLIFLPMVPTLVLMVAPVRTQAWMLAVPFLGQNQLILKIVRSEPIGVGEWTLSIGAGLALVVLAWLVAARLYHREHLAASS